LSRAQDLCFRYGGDEFVILMPETGAQAAFSLATEMLRALMASSIPMKNGLNLSVSASVGLATCPADGTTVHTIIGVADARMYDVKSNGCGQVHGVHRI
jgi:diguanylate cyclase (GGDEF)-like protein